MNQEILKNNIVVATIIFGVFLVLFGFVIKSAVGDFSNKGDSISVTGSAERLVESDTAKWNISLTKRTAGTDVAGANSILQKQAQTLSEFFVKSGIDPKNITTNNVQSAQICALTSQGYENCSLGVVGYNQTLGMVVESQDVYKIAELSKALETNFPTATFANNTVEYYFNKLKDIRVEMLSEATKNAKERAESVATAGGARVNKIVSLSSGVFQVTQKNSVDVSDYGTYDTSTIEKKISATVKVDFSLK